MSLIAMGLRSRWGRRFGDVGPGLRARRHAGSATGITLLQSRQCVRRPGSGRSGPGPVVRRYRLPFPVDLPRGDERGVPVGSHFYFPLTVVKQSVVESAEQHEVAHVGGSACGPVDDVVAFAPRWRCSASGERASSIPRDQRFSLPLGDRPGGNTEVEWRPVLVEHDRRVDRVAAEEPGCFDA